MKAKTGLFLTTFIFLMILSVIISDVFETHFAKKALASANPPYMYNIPAVVAREMQLVSQHKKLAVIFLGDSETRYQINQSIIQQIIHKTAYNAGVDGYSYPYWPFLFHKAVALKPDTIVFSISPALVYGKYHFAQYSASTGIHATLSDIPFLIYSKAKIKHITEFLSSALTQVIDFRALGLWRFFLKKTQPGVVGNCYVKSEAKHKLAYSCPNNLVYLVTTQYPKAEAMQTMDYSTRPINPLFLSYMKQITMIANRNHIQIVVVLVPNLSRHYILNVPTLEKGLNAKVINLSSFLIASKDRVYWNDWGHLSVHGQTLYSKAVGKALLKLQTR